MSKKKKLFHMIETRVDSRKYEELTQLLSQSTCRYMSELVRDILYNRKIRVQTYDNSRDKLLERLSAIRSELNAIGVNINQLTKGFNSEQNPSGRMHYAMQVATHYKKVDEKVDELLSLISNLSEQWLPK